VTTSAERIIQIGWGTGVKLQSSTVSFQFLATSGGYSETRTPYYVTTVNVGDLTDSTGRMKFVCADGTLARTGSVAFDSDNETLPSLIDWIVNKRKEQFSFLMGTQDLSYVQVDGCVWSRFSLSGNVSGAVTGTVDFSSSADQVKTLSWSLGSVFLPLQGRTLVPYWQTGNDDVTNWTLDVSQNVTPVYLNTKSEYPLYFRIGHWEVNITFETMINLQNPTSASANQVRLCFDKLFKPLKGFRLSQGVTKSTTSDPLKYQYTYSTHGEPTSYSDDNAAKGGVGNVFTITS
jgi:hypothetical protein